MADLAAGTPPGRFVEVGVWQGGSAQFLYEVAQFQKRSLHLFDTFTGIPHASAFDMHKVGDFSEGVNLEAMQKVMPQAAFHSGVFPATLPSWLDRIAFVHEDADQYQSTKDVIAHLWPRLIKGGVMLFDDYWTTDCPGSRKAIDESGLTLQEHRVSRKVYAVKE